MHYYTYLVYSGQRRVRNVLIVYLPHFRHVCEAVRAHRTEVVSGPNELVKAGLVYEMMTGRNLARLAARVDVLLAYGAVGAAQVLDALRGGREE